MTIDWNRLAQPFPPDEIKHRPGAAKWDHKESCQGARCRDAKNPDAHHQFSYIDARAVAERLDEIVTPAGWQFTCSVIPGSDIVKGRLEIIHEGGTVVREDHGYPNSDRDDEPIKAATSDALKRCAVLFGIGRHLYEDNKPSTNGSGRAASPSARPSAAPQRPVTFSPPDGVPEPPAWLDEAPGASSAPVALPQSVMHDQQLDPRDGFYGATCPKHKGRPWKETKYGPKCTAHDEDGKNGYCIWKPSRKWIAEHELEGAPA
jgi:hypothetical protein